MKTRPRALLVGGLAATLAACSGDDRSSETFEPPSARQPARTITHAHPVDETAAAFVIRVNTMLQNGDYAGAWAELHPAQQKILSASDLAGCVDAPAPLEATFKVKDSYSEPWPIPPSQAKQRSTAVKFRVLVASTDGRVTRFSVLETATQHVFDVGGRWRWILDPPDHNARCATEWGQ